MMKRLLLLICLLTGALGARAQDNIYLKNGNVLEVYIRKITKSVIYYAATPGSPQRYVKKEGVLKLVYKNGREVQIDKPKSEAARKRAELLGGLNNMITVSPLPLMFWGNYGGIGLGADYERYIGSSHRISVHVPVYLGFLVAGNENINDVYKEAVIVYTSPGVRFHLLSPERRADYAIGVSGLIGNANHTTYNDHTFSGMPNVDEQLLLTAVTLDNDLNITSRRKKIVFGIHTAVGPVFGDFGEDGKWMVQIGIKLGRRF